MTKHEPARDQQRERLQTTWPCWKTAAHEELLDNIISWCQHMKGMLPTSPEDYVHLREMYFDYAQWHDIAFWSRVMNLEHGVGRSMTVGETAYLLEMPVDGVLQDIEDGRIPVCGQTGSVKVDRRALLRILMAELFDPERNVVEEELG